jgi:DNA-binding IclR family transcriptional regulator
MAKNSRYFQINSIVKAFNLIEVLVTQDEFELAELRSLLDMPKTTVHRILLTLQTLNYVRQNPQNHKYFASIKFFELGRRIIEKSTFIEVASSHMIKLSESTGETVNLGVLDAIDIVCINKAVSAQALRLDQPIGSRVKAYCTSFGKAVLAFLPEKERKRLFSEQTISPCTTKSLRSVTAIERELRKIQEQGYAVDIEEAVSGISCVGAPIFDYTGKVLAGISIAGPTTRIKKVNIPHLAKLVVETAFSISKELGARGSSFSR